MTEPPYLTERQAGYVHSSDLDPLKGLLGEAYDRHIESMKRSDARLMTQEDVIAASSLTPRAKALREAEKLITGDRNKSYGSPTQNFQNTADLWNAQFRHMMKDGQEFTAAHVAQAMVLLKMARMIAGKKHDNWIDVIGYAACGVECDEDVAD